MIEAPALTADTPAKLNLTLDVLGRRTDGFHDLRSLVVGIDLRDRVTCRAGGDSGVTLECSEPALEGPDNLAHRAAVALATHLHRDPVVRIDLRKSIPVGGGLGGGSSDAAATLQLCNQLWNAGLDRAALARVGAGLGADIPLFFHLPSALMTGRGERVEPVSLAWSGWALLIFVAEAVSTAEVYRAWRPSDGRDLATDMDRAAAQAASAQELTSLLSNHLEPAVFRVAPAVARAHAALERVGAGPMRVSGAGSTLFRLYDDQDEAHEAEGQVRHHGIDWRTSVVAVPTGTRINHQEA